MISLEQVKMLESKVSRMIEYIKKVNDENTRLKEKLDSYEKRTGELEILFQRFKDDQGRIEDGILSALDLLNQFEDAVESKLSGDSKERKASASEAAAPKPAETKAAASKAAGPKAAEPENNAAEIIDLELDVLDEIPEDDESDSAVSGAELDIF